MGRLGGRQQRRLDIQRLVTQGDGSRSARPRLDLKEVRTDRIQRRQQKGFLLTAPDFNSFLLCTRAGAGAGAASPRVKRQARKRKL